MSVVRQMAEGRLERKVAVILATDVVGYSKPDAGLRLALRIGVNMGDVVQQEDNLVGDGVNIAARPEALAQTDSVSVSKPVHDLVQAKTDLVFHDLGTQLVKDNRFHAYDVLLDPSQKRRLGRPLATRPPVMFLEKGCEKASCHITALVDAGRNAKRIRQTGYVLIPCGEEERAIEFLNIAFRLEPTAKNTEIKQMIIAAHMVADDIPKALEVGRAFGDDGLRDKATRNLVTYIHLLNGDLDSASKLSTELGETTSIDADLPRRAAEACGYFCLARKRRENE